MMRESEERAFQTKRALESLVNLLGARLVSGGEERQDPVYSQLTMRLPDNPEEWAEAALGFLEDGMPHRPFSTRRLPAPSGVVDVWVEGWSGLWLRVASIWDVLNERTWWQMDIAISKPPEELTKPS
jgi:hypothetical protein